MDALFLCVIHETAGIHDQHIRAAGLLNELSARSTDHPGQFLAVYKILCATQRMNRQPKPLSFWHPFHSARRARFPIHFFLCRGRSPDLPGIYCFAIEGLETLDGDGMLQLQRYSDTCIRPEPMTACICRITSSEVFKR